MCDDNKSKAAAAVVGAGVEVTGNIMRKVTPTISQYHGTGGCDDSMMRMTDEADQVSEVGLMSRHGYIVGTLIEVRNNKTEIN